MMKDMLMTVFRQLVAETKADAIKAERARVAGFDPGGDATMSLASSAASSGAPVAVSAGQQNSRAG